MALSQTKPPTAPDPGTAGLVQIRRSAGAHAAQTGISAAPGSDLISQDRGGPGPRVYMETFGCQMNEADTALVLGRLGADGWVHVSEPNSADLILVNTCAVREKAEARVYGRTSQLLSHRAENPDLIIGIIGCMAEHLRDKLETRAPHIQLVAGPDSYRNIAGLARRALDGERAVDVELDKREVYEGLDGALAGPREGDGICGFITIQRGCDKFCSFCVVPFTRGRERSVPPREVLRQAQRMAAAGIRELTLLGQTVNSYVWDQDGADPVDFATLVKAVAQIEGIDRIRFTSPYPVDFSPALIEVIANEPKVCPYMHLPVQAGSDAVLERMRRGYDVAGYKEIIRQLRAAVPDIAISTDIMVGFCGETEEDHAQTLALMTEIEFDFAFMFAYSDREITYASKKLVDDVPPEVKLRRLREVIEIQERHTRAKYDARIGIEEEILVVRPTKRGNKLMGRTARFQKVMLPLDSARSGDMVRRTITGSTGHSLIAD
jgi:tRNA-2-methylthio-N6-dimethylallyladenosine synthase